MNASPIRHTSPAPIRSTGAPLGFRARAPFGFVVSLGLLATLGLLLGGCATGGTRYRVEVNALADSDWTARADITQADYILLPADPDTDTRDLQHREFERVVELALADRGLRRVDSAERADIAIFMRYGIGEKETQLVSYAAPYHVLDDYRFYGGFPGYYGYRGRGRVGRGIGYRPYANFSSIHRVPLTSQTRSFTTVSRFLELEARALDSDDPRTGEPVWSTEVRSRGEIDDLRRVFPVLVSAAVEYLASDTGQIVQSMIAEDDERVVRLRPAPLPDSTRSPEIDARIDPVIDAEEARE